MGFGKYIKKAFTNHWNLLAFLGGSAAALLSGYGVVLLPLVAAAEITYVGLLAGHPRFQSYVDAQEAKATRVADSVEAEQMLKNITTSLPRESLERFDKLRKQCWELQQIAADLKNPAPGNVDAPLENSQVAGLDRLLWIHLRLLYTEFALSRFLDRTREDEIRANIRTLEKRLGELAADDKQVQSQRVRKTLEDNLETNRARLTNLTKARENHELVRLEIERLENKIRGLSEMAVNRQEPEFISGQVDQVAESMLDTERTMNELRFATGLEEMDAEAPELLRRRAVETN
jgi:chemotaxis protein histidine kinase CheA